MGEVEADASEKLPIRLMDVLGTLASSNKGNIIFTEGSSRGWDFHVISHTWSKAIRDLSDQIGNLVIDNRQQLKAEAAHLQKQIFLASVGSCFSSAGMQIESGGDAYSHAFKEAADFSKVASYLQLRDFLRLLAGDGVKHVWFDALCIDQTNAEEKSREIDNMGSYYHRSQGCYVLAHGVGEGYQLWGKEGPRGTELPRWFSRVWTLQEFLLPCRLSFFVEALDPRFLEFVNKLARAKSKVGLCRCFCSLQNIEYEELVEKICDSDPQVDASWAWEFELRGESIKRTSDLDIDKEETEYFNSKGLSKHSAKLHTKTWSLGSTSVVCTQCQSMPMIRKAQLYGANDMPSLSTMMPESSNDRTSIYLVDREAYLGVMQCDIKMTEPPPSEGNKGVQDLRSLYAKLSSTRPWRAWDVIVEVGLRNCSVEEDRVLGILGLLGKAGGERSQLRSGQGLQDQIRDLARVCSPEVLVELCGMDVRPCSIPGMSWAPDFHDHRCHDIWYTYVHSRLSSKQRSLSMEAYRKSVSATGALKLRAKVVSAHVLPVTAFPVFLLQSMPFFKASNYPCSHLIVIPPQTPSPPGSFRLPLSRQSHDVLSSADALRPNLSNYGFIPMLCCDPDIESVSAPFINFKFPRFVSGCTHGGSMHIPMSTSSSTRSLATDNLSASASSPQQDAINRINTDELRFPIEMVLLAGTNAIPSGKRLQMIMLCLKSQAATELHKIGMLYLTTDPERDDLDVEVEKRLHFESASMRECTIGGFGADVSAHVHINTSTRVQRRPHNNSSFSTFVLRVLKAVSFRVPTWMRRDR